MPAGLYAVIVISFLIVAAIVVRRTQRGAIVARLPLLDGETVILEESGLKLFHRSRKTAAHGGGTTTYRVHSTFTDRRGPPRHRRPRGQAQVRDPARPRLPDTRATGSRDGLSGLPPQVRALERIPDLRMLRGRRQRGRRRTERRASASSSRSPKPAPGGATHPRCGSRRRRPHGTRRRSRGSRRVRAG